MAPEPGNDDDDDRDVPTHSLDYAPADPRERLTGNFWAAMLIVVGVGVLAVDICSAVRRNNRAPATTAPSASSPRPP